MSPATACGTYGFESRNMLLVGNSEAGSRPGEARVVTESFRAHQELRMSISVIYEDDNVIVLNKPSGIAVHKTRPDDPQSTVVDFLIAYYPSIQEVGEDSLRPGIVHRLDKDTSGVMVVAKNNPSFFYLKKLFQNREVTKEYIALVYGVLNSEGGDIDAPLGKIGTRQTTRIHGKKTLFEREALTHYRLLKKFKNYTLLNVYPRTGRTHQIRIHLKHIGHPIVGDSIYGPRKQNPPSGLNRLFLHAKSIKFSTPDGKALHMETDLPKDLQRVLEDLPA